MKAFVSILIALVCAELVRSESSRGKVEETQNKAEAAKAKLLLEQMKHSFRNANGVESVFNQLSTVLSKLESRTSSLVSDMSTVKSDLTSVKSTVNSEKSALTSLKSTVNSEKSALTSLKSTVNTLKSKQIRCQSSWGTVSATVKTVTYSPAFSTTPALIAAFSKVNTAGTQKYMYYSAKSSKSFGVALAGTTAERGGDNEFTWMACGH